HHSVRQATALAARWQIRMDGQNRARTALQSTLNTPVVDIPFLFNRSLAFSELQALSKALEKGMSTQ
ncbi:MAG: hypothetical protein ACPGTU_10195, partial [Myxococcota bacterium]